MNHQILLEKLIVTALALCLMVWFTEIVSAAYYHVTTYPTDSSIFWSIVADGHDNTRVKTYLRENGYVLESIDDDELDYLVLMTIQLSTLYKDISPGLALALVATESSFDRDCVSAYDAVGLTQVIPYYHQDRLTQFIEKDERYSKDLFHDPRLNIMIGLDYLNDTLFYCEGDLYFALMQYNQGPTSAYRTYKEKGIISEYASKVVSLAAILDDMIQIEEGG